MDYNSSVPFNQMMGGSADYFKMEPQNNSGGYLRKDFPNIGNAPNFPADNPYFHHAPMLPHGGLQGGGMDSVTTGLSGMPSQSNYIETPGIPVPSLTPMPAMTQVNPLTSKPAEVSMPSLTPAPMTSVTSQLTQEHSMTSEDRKSRDYKELDQLASDVALEESAQKESVPNNDNTQISQKEDLVDHPGTSMDHKGASLVPHNNDHQVTSRDRHDSQTQGAARDHDESDHQGVIGVSQCSVCTIKFPSQEALHVHIKTHGRICLVCFSVGYILSCFIFLSFADFKYLGHVLYCNQNL